MSVPKKEAVIHTSTLLPVLFIVLANLKSIKTETCRNHLTNN